MLTSRSDVLIKISKVVNSQKACAVHIQTGEGAENNPVMFSKGPQDGAAAASQALPQGPRKWQVAAAIITVKSALQVRSDCLTKTLLDLALHFG